MYYKKVIVNEPLLIDDSVDASHFSKKFPAKQLPPSDIGTEFSYSFWIYIDNWDNNFNNFKVSVKASDIFTTVASYEKLSEICDYPLHVGLTEAGTYLAGSIKSSISIGQLLQKGIGDTIRVSLTADPVEEIKVGFEILKSLQLRTKGIQIVSCPSCARQAFPVIETVKKLEQRLSHIKEPLTLSIIGCIVNGPGEALKSDIGVTGGGKGTNMIYVSGVADHKITNPEMVDHIVDMVEKEIKLLND